jgi:tetratricopeptide (TPR) repeat protein
MSMAKIRIQCSECGHEARVPEQFRGKKVRCLHCHAKLRIPEDAPLAEPRKAKQKVPRRPKRSETRASLRESQATRGGPSSRTRNKGLSFLRQLLQGYDHAIESIPRGFEVDLRGEAFGLARNLVSEMLDCRAIRDVKLAGGTGQSCMVISLQGWEFNPDDSFADDDEDTEVFARPSSAASAAGGDWTPHGIVESAVSLDPQTDVGWHLQNDAPREPPPESTMQSVFVKGASSGRVAGDPVRDYEEGRRLVEDGEPEEAVQLFEKAVRADKNFSLAVVALGKAYASMGDYQRARRAFRHLTKIDPDDPQAQVMYAASAVRCDRLEEAKVSLATAIKLDPEYRQAYRYAAQLYEKLGEPEKARKFRARYQALKLRG